MKEFERIKNKLWDNLFEWKKVFRIIEGDVFTKMVCELLNIINNDKHFYPSMKCIFRAFKECSPDKCKGIIVGFKPGYNLEDCESSNGIAYSSYIEYKRFEKVYHKNMANFYNDYLCINYYLTEDTLYNDYNIWIPFHNAIIEWGRKNNLKFFTLKNDLNKFKNTVYDGILEEFPGELEFTGKNRHNNDGVPRQYVARRS